MATPGDDITIAADAPTTSGGQAAANAFTLQVVSPSVGVSVPLSFPRLPATTTIKELKAKIRDTLPSKPSDENQRLIHRGRMLGNELDTMIDVFGKEPLESLQPQTLHLVLRPTAIDDASTQPATPTPGQPPISGLPNLPQPRPSSTPAGPALATNGGIPPHIPFHHLHNHQHIHALEHNNPLAQRIQQLHREAQRLQQDMGSIEQRYRSLLAANGQHGHHGPATPLPRVAQSPIPMPPTVQALLAQQQRERAAQGRQGVSDTHSFPTFGMPTNSGRSSPAPSGHTATYVQQGVTPNGDTWRTTMTVNETRTTMPLSGGTHGPGHHSIADGNHYNPVPDLMAHMHAHARPSSRPPSRVASHTPINMERSASGISFGNANVTATSTPSIGNNANASSSSTFAHPQPTFPILAAPNPSLHHFNPPTTPTVYILSSPSGPRALLVTGQDNVLSRSYPQVQTQQVVRRPHVALPEFRNRHARPGRQQGPEEQQQQQQPVAPPILGGHANPQAGAVAAGLPRMLWLVVRLIGVVYFISSSSQSWARWALTVSLAVIIFIVNIGIFNGAINDIWAPVRRHVENIIPLAGPDAALIPAANAAPIPQVAAPPPEAEPLRTGPHGELDPQQVADRIIAQRRRQEGWLPALFRRVEHSLLLFLASLVPGVGERHIAAREAEATERQRQIDAAAAAAVAAEAVTDSQNEETEIIEGSSVESESQAIDGREGNHGRNETPPVAAT